MIEDLIKHKIEKNEYEQDLKLKLYQTKFFEYMKQNFLIQ